MPIESYKGIFIKILHHCMTHNVDYMTTPACTLQGCGCPQCDKERYHKSRGKSHENYLKELQEKNPNVIPLEEYISSHDPILHKCLIHNIEWKTRPSVVLQGTGCPQCHSEKIAKFKTKTHEQYVKELAEINPNIIILEKYKGSETKTLHKCLIHNYEWLVTPNHLLSGKCQCPQCAKEFIQKKLTKTHEAYEQELKEKGISIIPLEKYQTEKIKILHKCPICGFEWKVKPDNILIGKGCPNCNRSKGENQIKQWLLDNNIIFEPQKKFNNCRDIYSLPFDFYLPEKNKCIEYDGIQHFIAKDYFGGQSGLEYTQKHDRIKNEFCKSNNIPLLRIPYYADIEKELEQFLFN